MTTEGRTRGLDRLVNYSDAIVAIAATLLILPLVELVNDIGSRTGGQLVVDNWQQIAVFALSFVVIARFWVFHHDMYETVTDYSPALVSVNMVWLISIAFLPFPTELLAHDPGDQATTAIYVGTMTVTTAASAASKWVIIRTPGLEEPQETIGALVPYIAALIVMVVACALSAVSAKVGLLALLLLLATPLVERPLMSRLGRTPPSD